MHDIGQLVKDRLPFLLSGTLDTLIERKKIEVFYELQDQTGKTDEEVELEESYTNKLKIFFADYIAYQILDYRVMVLLAGSDTETATGNKTVSKATADVLEVEFEVLKIDDVALGINTKVLLQNYKERACAQAKANDLSLSICDNNSFIPVPFRYIN